MMHVLNFSLILAFLFTSAHMLLDHGVGGQRAVAFFPHLSAPHAHRDEDPAGTDHTHHEDPAPDRHNPMHHQADTHSHFVWYTHEGSAMVPHVASWSGVGTMPVDPVVAVFATLVRYHLAHAPPGHGLSLALQWSILRI